MLSCLVPNKPGEKKEERGNLCLCLTAHAHPTLESATVDGKVEKYPFRVRQVQRIVCDTQLLEPQFRD